MRTVVNIRNRGNATENFTISRSLIRKHVSNEIRDLMGRETHRMKTFAEIRNEGNMKEIFTVNRL